MKKLAVLVSNKGTGSILRALLEAGFNVAVVAADTEDAAGIQLAKEKGLHFMVLPYKKPESLTREEYRDRYSSNIAKLLNKNKIDVAVLAGFNRILTKPYFDTFRGTTINSHPGAIPDREGGEFVFEGEVIPWNQGLMTDAAVVNFLGRKNASATIHIVTEKTDFGPILERVFVPVRKNDTVATLYLRLKKAEHKGLIKVLLRGA